MIDHAYNEDRGLSKFFYLKTDGFKLYQYSQFAANLNSCFLSNFNCLKGVNKAQRGCGSGLRRHSFKIIPAVRNEYIGDKNCSVRVNEPPYQYIKGTGRKLFRTFN